MSHGRDLTPRQASKPIDAATLAEVKRLLTEPTRESIERELEDDEAVYLRDFDAFRVQHSREVKRLKGKLRADDERLAALRQEIERDKEQLAVLRRAIAYLEERSAVRALMRRTRLTRRRATSTRSRRRPRTVASSARR